MKKLSIFCTLIVVVCLTNSYAQQPSLKDCNDVFDKIMTAKVKKFDRETFKQFLYEYLLSTSDKREELKQKAKNDLGIGLIIEGLPIDIGFSSQSDSKSDFLFNTKTEVEKRGFVTNEEVNMIVSEYYQQGAFDSYKACLEETAKVLLNINGVFATIEGDINSSFIIQISFSNNIGKESITINQAIFSGSNIKYGLTFSKGTKIKNNQSIYQHLQRIPGEPLNISISFEDEIKGISRTYPSELYTPLNTMPIGTIISSTLDYQTFLDVNSDRQKNFDIKKSTWAPCDGRLVSGSKYGDKIATVPDLRGVFLRGINDLGVDGAPPVKPDQLNPENQKAGVLQSDDLRSHTHT